MEWLSNINWRILVQTVLGAGIGSAVVQAIFVWWRERGERRRRVTYLAIQIAVELEAFEARCFEYFSDIELHITSQGAAGTAWAAVPDKPEYPRDPEGWRALEPAIVDKLLGLPGEVSKAQGHINFVTDVTSAQESSAACQTACAELGLKAALLGAELRERYSLPPPANSGKEHLLAHLKGRG